MTAREEILQRIRTALPGEAADVAGSYAGIARAYDRAGEMGRKECLELFIDRLVDYDSLVVELNEESEIRGSVERVLLEAGEERLLLAEGFPEEWRPAGVEVIVDRALPTEAMERAQAVLTTCEAAVASTGTIVLVHGGAQGRRAITLLPDHHVCLVRREQVYELVPEALRTIAGQSGRPVTTISGPSATADIEMTRIRGVHGPRRLTVILYS